MNIRLMCVDDNPAVCEALCMKFSSLSGYQWLGSLSKADDLLRAVRDADPQPNLIILDIEMPGKDVFEAADELAEHLPSGRRPRVIFFSGSEISQTHDRVRMLSASRPGFALGLVSKHDGIDTLHAAIQQAFAA
jgi:DNA-binding NarL/FixJ family response regulator